MIDFAIGRDRVEVPLDQRHIACSRHGEPFRANWPLGWESFATDISTRALGTPALQAGLQATTWRAIDLIWEDLPRRRHPDEVRDLLARRPACEWVTGPELLAAYIASGIGVVRLCQVCRLLRPGAPFGLREGQGIRVISHACFRCVIDNAMGAA